MKTISCVALRTSLAYFTLVLAGLAPAQNLPPDLAPISSDQVSGLGHSYYSIQRFPWCPPLPLNWLSDDPGVQLYVSPSMGTNAVFVDDTATDYEQRAANRAAQASESSDGPPPLPEGGGGGGGGGGGTNHFAYSYGPNDLWLEPLSLSSNLFHVILHGTTNGCTYLISSVEALDPAAYNTWLVEGSLQGTNTSTQFALGVATRTNSLFIRAEACEECATTALPLWWQLAYCGVTGVDPNGDYDADGSTNLTEYLEVTDPNTIRFSISVTNQYVSSTAVPLQLNIIGGVPSYMAMLVNETNGSWQPFTSTNLSVPTPTNGVYVVSVGLCGLAPNSTQTWQSVTLFREATPLTLSITNLTQLHGSRPFIDPAGYTSRSVRSITWEAVAADGITNSGRGLLVARDWSLHEPYYVTNYFQCVDVPLAVGWNSVSIRAVDWAGMAGETNFLYHRDNAGGGTPPGLRLIWPQNGTRIYGDYFNVQAWTGDDTATVMLQYFDTNGVAQTQNTLVERGGNVWVIQAPLRDGTNNFLLSATDACGNTSSTNFMVIQSDAAWSVTPLTQEELKYGYATVRGTIADPDASVSVNGIQGTNWGNGDWAVFNVPLPSGGTVATQAKAHLASGEDLETLFLAVRGPIVFAQAYSYELDYSYVFSSGGGIVYGESFVHTEVQWERGGGGTNRQTETYVYYDYMGNWTNLTVTTTVWPADNGYWPSLPGQKRIDLYEDGVWNETRTNSAGAPDVEWVEKSSAAGSVPDGEFPAPYSESSRCEVRLFTGGRGERESEALLGLSAALTVERAPDPNRQHWPLAHPEDQDFDPFLQPDSPPVFVPWEETMLSTLGELGNDGNLWVMETCSLETIITLQAPGSFNGPLPGVQEPDLKILANSVPLDPRIVVPNAQFCVGQNVSFTLGGLPAGVIPTYFQWTLEGTYVNDHTNAGPDSSENYFKNVSLLSNSVLSNCWWLSGSFNPAQTYEASLCCTLIFTNGNPSTSYRPEGLFSMHRPQIYDHQRLVPGAVVTNGVLRALPPGGFGAVIHSGVDGQIGTTQLIKGYETNATPSFGIDTTNTWKLDTQEFYRTPSINPTGLLPVTAGAEASPAGNAAYVTDKPDISCNGNTALHLDFQDYIRFQPSGSGSIFVTLATFNWHIYATAGLSNAVYVLTSAPDGQADAAPTDSFQFPCWTNVVSGGN